MVTTIDLVMWLLTTLVEAFVVCVFVIQGLSRKFLFLNLYFALCVIGSVRRYVVVSYRGLASLEYAYFYYATDAVLTLALLNEHLAAGCASHGKQMERQTVERMRNSCGRLLLFRSFVLNDRATRDLSNIGVRFFSLWFRDCLDLGAAAGQLSSGPDHGSIG